MTTLCTNCIHRFDLEYDCTEHEQEFIQEGQRHIVLSCTGHAPVSIVEKVNPPAPLGTRKPVPA